MWQKIKLVALVAAILLLLIVTLQNTATTQTKFLFYEMNLPLAASLFLAALIGFAAGMLAMAYWMARRRRHSK